jgi:hypothetical protein
VPKDPVTSGNAEAGVFAYVQAYAGRSGRMPGSVDYSWTESWDISPGQPLRFRDAEQPASNHSSGGDSSASMRLTAWECYRAVRSCESNLAISGAVARDYFISGHRAAPPTGSPPSVTLAADWPQDATLRILHSSVAGEKPDLYARGLRIVRPVPTPAHHRNQHGRSHDSWAYILMHENVPAY